jgi:MFS family permease
LGDLFGHRRIYLLAAGAFIVFTVLAATARNFTWLIVFRGLQGLCTSPGFTASMAYIGSAFGREERGRAMGIQGMAAGLGWTVGPFLGGLLMLRFPWQAILWAEIPLMAIAFLVAWRLMPEDARSPGLPARAGSRQRLDVVGAGTLTASALVLMLGFGQVGQAGWTGGSTLAFAGGFAALLAVFFLNERRHPSPFVPLGLFAGRRFPAAIALSALTVMLMLAMVLLVPVYLQEVNGVDPATAGLFITALSVARVLFAPVAGRVADARGPRLPALAAAGLMTALALGFAFRLTPDVPGWLIVVAMFAFGAGVAFSQIPVNAAATYLAAPAYLGLAMGVYSMITYSSGSLGQTFFGVLLRTLSGASNAPLAAAPRPALLGAFSAAFLVVAGMAALAGALALRMPGRELGSDGVVAGR